MKKRLLMFMLLFTVILINKTYAQNIAINETGASPDTSAMFDISSTTKGFLTPRMTTTQRDLIPLPATGLLVYNTTTSVFNVNTGTPVSPVWTVLTTVSTTGWSTVGNAGLNSGTNFIGTTDNVSVRFKSNGSERMVLDSNGRLGVGTTAPTNLLSLGGNAARTIAMERHTTANTAGNILNIQSGSATSGATDKNGGDLYLKSGISTGTGSSNIYFQTDSAASSSGTSDNTLGTRMTIKGNGMIGLGTTNPVANWHMYGNSRSGFVPLNAGAGGGPEIAFGRGGFGKPGASIQFCDYDAYGGGLSFNVHKGTANGADGTFADNWPTDVVQAMTIDNKGLVAIGHAYPTSTLHVVSSGAKTASFTGNTFSNITTSSTASINKVGLEVSSTGTWDGTSANNTGLYVSSVTGGTNNYDAIFNGGGYVGIGTTAPTAKLYVEGTNTDTNLIKINVGRDGVGYGNRADNKGILFETQSSANTGNIARISAGDTSTSTSSGVRYLSFSVGKPLTEVMYMVANASGVAQVGIGTSTPTTALQVAGGITSTSATNGIGYATGSGGTVTQATNKSTGVTLNKVSGSITMNNAALNAGNEVSFIVTNSTVAATDVPVVAIASVGTPGSYLVSVGAVAAGSFRITLSNVSAGNLSQAVVLNFVIIKGSTN